MCIVMMMMIGVDDDDEDEYNLILTGPLFQNWKRVLLGKGKMLPK